jgi:small subunit ribosomal protein S6e
MAKFKIILSDPETGKSQMLDLEGSRAVPLIGRKLGESIDGTAIGLGGHKLKITGGSDKDGFPMRPDIHGGVKVRVVITNSTGFHSSNKGERRRKTVRGNVITDEIVQVNMKIIEKPRKKAARTAAAKPDSKTEDSDKENVKKG